jgi:hypothetical protein
MFACRDKKQTGNDTSKDQVSKTQEKKDAAVTIAFDSASFAVDCSGAGNFFVTEDDARKWMKHFAKDARFRGEGTGRFLKEFVSNVWVDACVINSLVTFFRDHSGYDGVRIYWGAYQGIDQSQHPEQEFEHQATIVIVPTKSGTANHAEDPDVNISIPCAHNFRNINLRSNDLAKHFEDYYRMTHRRETDNSILSKGVWFDKCVFEKIAMLFTLYSAEHLDGVRIYSVAYDKKPMVPSQVKDHQSTFVIVPTSICGSKHEDRFDVVKEAKQKFTDGGAYNHGELCPSVCP